MDDAGFQITNKARARQVFPKRFREVAARSHGYDLGDDYGLNADIAARLRVDRSAVTRWMGGSLPGIKNLLRIAEAYNVSPNYLVGNDNDVSAFTMRREGGLSWEQVMRVLRIMSEVRQDAGRDISDDRFAEASVEILRMVEADPSMPEYAITGAAYRLIKGNGASPGGADSDA